MLLALALVLAGAPVTPSKVEGLASEDAEARLKAVQAWAKKQRKPLLAHRDARDLQDCIELAPVAETGCAQPARLCPLREGDDGSAGTRRESLSLVLQGDDHLARHLKVWWSAAYEPKVAECDPPEPLFDAPPPDQRAKDVLAWRKAHAKEYARCVARLEKDSRDDAAELTCDVVLVNACRREAFTRCKARNLGKGVKPPPETVQRVEL